MTPDELRDRLATYAREVTRFARPLLTSLETRDAAGQLMRAAASAAANHRAAGRARSHAEFTSKIGVALEEIDESQFWLEHLHACRLADPAAMRPLLEEVRQLVAILTTSNATARAKSRRTTAPAPRKDGDC